ncbi:uncharacterized protein BX663DRAFT_494551 [Cokeromyces recurvatus]|uniref:uncharacterized protein n=1 Tax=Cokeromyces recurvatus TaxID=90255 RepID=UPI002220A144|nr:uncharacterized protein BX663DRAFT_494551 [Cokeromyces recurvatus]KAI7907026.1 hypothetical protein BX663DRAFT_494551 [Cokeromyces recurvatus]
MYFFKQCLISVLICLHSPLLNACGIAVHNEITYRSIENFIPENDIQQSYKNDILDSVGFVQAGSFFPDWGYQCLGNNQQSEDAHWPTFIKVAVNYVREVYPINQFHSNKHVKGLISFIFAIMSHDMADIKWHSLGGLSDYFIVAMANSDFHSNDEEAHLAADAGGEFTLRHSSELSYLNETWQVPIKDIIEIYKRLYINTTTVKVPLESHLRYCMATAFAASKIDVEFGQLMFGYYGSRSPFLIEEFYDYYRGGIEDISGSVTDCYPQMIDAFENGAIHSDPDILCANYFSTMGSSHHNKKRKKKRQITCPLIQSQCKSSSLLHNKMYESYDSVSGVLTITLDKRYTKNQYTTKKITDKESLLPIVEETTVIDKQRYGIRNKNDQYQFQVPLGPKKMNNNNNSMNENIKYSATNTINNEINQQQCLSLDNNLISGITLTLSTSFARLGHQVIIGDFNGNGQLDMAISAPYYYNHNRHIQTGAVFILQTVSEILLNENQYQKPYDIRNFTQNQLLEGDVNHGRFGWSMLSIDMNQDGIDDLVVSTPFLEGGGSGWVDVYFGRVLVGLSSSSQPDIRIFLSQESLLGTVLVGIDVNQDGFKDLIIGCPLCSIDNQSQTGRVYIIKSSSSLARYPATITQADWIIDNPNIQEDVSRSAYDHFGESILLVKDTLLIGAPGYCINMKQKVGRVYAFDIKTKKLKWIMSGSKEFQQYGKRLATDNKGSLLAISSPSEETSIGLRKFWQGGTVRIYDWDKIQSNKGTALIPRFEMENGMISIIKGRTNAGHLGQSILFVNDDNNHNISSIWIGEPLSEQEKGRIYHWSFNNRNSQVRCIRNNQLILARFGSQIGQLGTNAICITSQHYGQNALYSGAVTLLKGKII